MMKTENEGDFLIITDGISMNVNSWVKPKAFIPKQQTPHSYYQDGYGRGGHSQRGGYIQDRGGFRGKPGGFNKRGGY
jgi:hypothetical protein